MKTWQELDTQDQADLTAWFNVCNPTEEDYERLAELFDAGRFSAWDCQCGRRCYKGDPTNWNHFQGVCQVDYCSYPGNAEKYTLDHLMKLCDDCRMESP